ncbi:uncharacterized protein G2W53_041210 [Senna tora]|uniref:Uncharacterized protein n=1 Tax=Senna tora TaxID=362788 RepID=A0A834W2P4_9FABA|nr:uncharacterized protein G2W53_041210 [Senna tora]
MADWVLAGASTCTHCQAFHNELSSARHHTRVRVLHVLEEFEEDEIVEEASISNPGKSVAALGKSAAALYCYLPSIRLSAAALRCCFAAFRTCVACVAALRPCFAFSSADFRTS